MSTYITPAQIKEKSRVESLLTETDENLEKLILEAEKLVDAYCGFWEKAHKDQERLFPRKHEETVPQEISDAALAMAEHIFLQGAPSASDEVTEERIGGYSYKKTVAVPEVIPEKVKLLLRGFRKLTGKVNIKLTPWHSRTC